MDSFLFFIFLQHFWSRQKLIPPPGHNGHRRLPGNLIFFNLFPSRPVQGDQLNMVVFFWYPVKSDLSSVHIHSSIRFTSHCLQGTRKPRPCLPGHPIHYEPSCTARIGIPLETLLHRNLYYKRRKTFWFKIFMTSSSFIRQARRTVKKNCWRSSPLFLLL